MANRRLFEKFELHSVLRSNAIVITTDGQTDGGIDRISSNVLEFRDDQMSPRNPFNISRCYIFFFFSSYLAITTCYRSWPQLICDTIGVTVNCLPLPADNSKEVLICHEKGWWFGVRNNHRSI